MELPYQKCQRELEELLEAQYPLIFLRSVEEIRALNCVVSAHQNILKKLDAVDNELAKWNSLEGFRKYSNNSDNSGIVTWEKLNNKNLSLKEDIVIQGIQTLHERLEQQASCKLNSQNTYILPDWSALIQQDCYVTARHLKELILSIERKRPRPRMSLIIIGADWSIPTLLRNHIHILDLPLPVAQELHQNIFSLAETKYNVNADDARRLAEESQGIPLQSASQVAKLITAKNLWSDSRKAGELLLEIKKQEIRKTGILEYYESSGGGLNVVGGLEKIKEWIQNRRVWFEQDKKPELRPRAILLEGFPGCGKSFIAKAIAQEWRVPQINFEISRLQSKWIGESESNTHQALRAIEASAPNILFMDEIEKAFSGIGGDSSGVSTRQFGTFLSWLNDHQYPIFFIATSNNRQQLPPELFRAGRFDEIFIVMPPNSQERYEILRAKIESYQVYPIDHSILNFLVEETSGFTGAELEKIVKEIMYLRLDNFNSKEHWKYIIEETKPQYRTAEMQNLLKHYLNLLNEGGGKPASAIEINFLESLIRH